MAQHRPTTEEVVVDGEFRGEAKKKKSDLCTHQQEIHQATSGELYKL